MTEPVTKADAASQRSGRRVSKRRVGPSISRQENQARRMASRTAAKVMIALPGASALAMSSSGQCHR
jgi:hypothetical protein